MYLPSPQYILTAGLGLITSFKSQDNVIKGKILDFTIEECVDGDGNIRCSRPFLVTESTCYDIKWTTEGILSHTTAEVHDVGSGEMVHYQDADGNWTPKKTELVYLDFKPKIAGQENKTVTFEVNTCT